MSDVAVTDSPSFSPCDSSEFRNAFFVPEAVTYDWLKSTCDMLDAMIPVVADEDELAATHDRILRALDGMTEQSCKIAADSATFHVGQK